MHEEGCRGEERPDDGHPGEESQGPLHHPSTQDQGIGPGCFIVGVFFILKRKSNNVFDPDPYKFEDPETDPHQEIWI